MKPVVLRAVAARDVDEAFEYYLAEGDSSVAEAFIAAIEDAIRHISAAPASGSSRYSIELDIEELRCWVVRRFPYLLFYIEHADSVDVWRVLHAQRDIAAWLRSEPHL